MRHYIRTSHEHRRRLSVKPQEEENNLVYNCNDSRRSVGGTESLFQGASHNLRRGSLPANVVFTSQTSINYKPNKEERQSRRLKMIKNEIHSNKLLTFVLCIAALVVIAITYSMYRMVITAH